MLGIDKSPENTNSHTASPMQPPMNMTNRPAWVIRLAPSGVIMETPTVRRKILVELTGIEPVASWLQTRRSPS